MEKKTIKNEEGSALVLVMMVLLVLSTLGAALGVVTIGSLNLSENNQNINSAYYIAQAGANMAYEEMKSIVEDTYEKDDKIYYFDKMDKPFIDRLGNNTNSITYSDEIFTTNKDSKATVTLIEKEKKTNSKEYVIVSIGEVDGRTKTVEKPVTLRWPTEFSSYIPLFNPINAAIAFRESVNIDSWSKLLSYNEINGDILYSKNRIPFIFNLTWGMHHRRGSQRKNKTTWEDYITHLNQFYPSTPEQRDLEIPQSSGNYNTNHSGKEQLNLSRDVYYEKLEINSNFSINAIEDEVNLFVDELVFPRTADISIEGKVNIFVKKRIEFTPISWGNIYRNLNINLNGESNQLNIIYYGNNHVNFPENFKYKGSILLEKADAYFSYDTNINGTLYSGKNLTFKPDVYKNKINVDGLVISRGNTWVHENVDINGAIVAGRDINVYYSSGWRESLDTLLFAPQGTVTLNPIVHINGTIIANEITMYTGSKINYEEGYINYLPPEYKGIAELGDLIETQPALEQ